MWSVEYYNEQWSWLTLKVISAASKWNSTTEYTISQDAITDLHHGFRCWVKFYYFSPSAELVESELSLSNFLLTCRLLSTRMRYWSTPTSMSTSAPSPEGRLLSTLALSECVLTRKPEKDCSRSHVCSHVYAKHHRNGVAWTCDAWSLIDWVIRSAVGLQFSYR